MRRSCERLSLTEPRRETSTFDEIGDEGEVWCGLLRVWTTDRARFGEDSVERMVSYLTGTLQEMPHCASPAVLDLGTGNGHLLFDLVEAADELCAGVVDVARLRGVDYSQASVRLAQSVGAKRGNGCEKICFDTADLRNPACVAQLAASVNDGQGWDVVCDKGTVSQTLCSPLTLQMDAVSAASV